MAEDKKAKEKEIVDKAIKAVPKSLSKEDKQTLKDIKSGKKK